MSREAIYAALFAKVSDSATFKTKSRRFRPFSDVAPADQPAIFQVQGTQSAEQRRQQGPIWTLRADLFIYYWEPDPNVVPSTGLNTYVDAVEAALAPDAVSNVQTLGGLVSHCWIEGDVAIFEGTIAEQAVAIIPVNILLGGRP